MLDTLFVLIKCTTIHYIVLVYRGRRNEKSIFAAVHSLYKFIFIAPQHAKCFQQPQSSYSSEMTLKMSKFYSGNPRQNILAKRNFMLTLPPPVSVLFFC